MKKETHSSDLMNNSIFRIVFGTGVFLLLPFLGSLFVEGFNWGLEDFVAIGGLLIGTGLTYELGVKNMTTNATHRLMLGVTLVGLALLVWIELAVGLFTTWGN